jgi:hypothetical protein
LTWRRAVREERAAAYLWAAVAGAALLLAPFWSLATPLLPTCLFHAWTGLPCPGCGTTRAALALLDAEPLTALSFNPLAATGGALFLVGGLVAPVWVLGRGPIPVLPTPLPLTIRVGAVALIAANWAYLLWAGI